MAYTNEKETLKRVKAKENKREQQILHTWASSDEDDFKFISVLTQTGLAILRSTIDC